MDKIALSAMLLFIIPLYMPKIVAAEEYLFLFCSKDFQNYMHNSPFENNLIHLLGLLPSRTSVTGFNSTSFGDTNKVYDEALCREGISTPQLVKLVLRLLTKKSCSARTKKW